jgi:hypothetical protein
MLPYLVLSMLCLNYNETYTATFLMACATKFKKTAKNNKGHRHEKIIYRPPPPSPSMQTVSHLNSLSALLKGELQGKGVQYITNFHHHNVNGGAVDKT